MKPKDLKAAFSWEKRRPLIEDRVFHVPSYYDQHSAFAFPGWQDEQLFGNVHPICIEYCTGNGAWIVERAKQFPQLNWMAVEMRYDRVRKIWSKIKNENLSNLIVVCAEAWTFTCHYLADHSIESVYINFPDPWPKEKHKKHRLMQPRFLNELARILKPGKKVMFVSDDTEYVQSTLDLFKLSPNFEPVGHATENAEYGTSWFETLWRRKGKNINYLEFMCRY